MIARAAAAAASTQTGFLGVDWSSIAEVFVVALIAVVLIVSSYSLGLRLLAVGSPIGDGSGRFAAGTRPPAATVGAFACIAIGVAGVLYGVYLVIPLFHGS
jgi:hypothetical protein